MDFEEDMSVRDKAMDVSDEDGGKAKVDERFEEASMPYFIERFLYVHKYGRRVAFDIFGMHGCLCELKDFVDGRFVYSEACLFWI